MSIALSNRRPISRYQPPRRAPPPLPPRWTSAQAEMARSPFSQFVFLSMLLHALFIALFGAPSGGSREGRAVWGDLNVVIAGKARTAEDAKPPAAVAPSPPESTPVPAPVIPHAPPAPSVPEAPPAATVQDTIRMHEVVPRLLDRLPTAERPIETPLLVPPPTEIQAFPLPPPPAPPPVARQVTAPPIEVARPMTAVPPTLLDAPSIAPPAPPKVERAPAEAPPIAAPLVQPLPQAVVPVPERALAETPQIAPAPPAPAARPAQSTPVEVPAVPTLPVAPPALAAPARIEPVARPVDRALMEELPVVPSRPPTALERALTGPPEIVRPVEQVGPQEIGPRTAVPGGTSGATIHGPDARPFGPRPGPGDFPRGREGPGSDYDPTAAPSMDADAMRRRAAQLGREGTGNRALLPFAMPPVAPPKSKVETALEKARKPDCRDAYKHFGLAAIVPLLANELGEGSCRW